MAKPNDKLAQSLEKLRAIQSTGKVAIQTREISRTHRERLQKNGYLEPVMRGWYIATSPEEHTGDSTAWHASFWNFCASYLDHRFGEEWYLAPEPSLRIHTESCTIPNQVLVYSPKATNTTTDLLYQTSIFEMKASGPNRKNIVVRNGLRIIALEEALIDAPITFFQQSPLDARAALAMIRDASGVLHALLKHGKVRAAGRLAGGFRNIGQEKIATEIIKTMKQADYDIRENDPFEEQLEIPKTTVATPPIESRIRLLWQKMREDIIGKLPQPTQANDPDAYLKNVDDVYQTDAYNSLSIEGYRVTPELIEKIRAGIWNPETTATDRQHRDTLAARGYWDAFQKVRESVAKCLAGENGGSIADKDHPDWYRALFGPSVQAGILEPHELAGYRNSPVYIRNSKHVPPSPEGLRNAIPTFFELLTNEPDPGVRVVLGHFIFVYIHPYTDGNGRIGRFLMNVMMASAGYPWTVIPVERRAEYMTALEAASTNNDIVPFTKFIGSLLRL